MRCVPLLSRLSLLALAATPAIANAQGVATASDPVAATAPASDIVITGTRIRRPDYAAPNPVVSTSRADLDRSGETNLATFLERVPALTNSLDSTRTAGNAQPDGSIGQVGLNLLDLRGLGPNRTLVLVNGRRHVAAQAGTAAVDINAIPVDLVERVDVLTGAASAVYGADGVSGVVNFVLRRNFDGVAAHAQAGISQHGDAGSRLASLILGRNFAGARGNATIAFEYGAQDPLGNDDRAYLRQGQRLYFVNLDNYDPTRLGSYQVGPVGDLRYPYGSNQGYVVIGDQVYRGDGAIYTPGRFLQNDGYSVGGDDTPVAGYIGDILARTRRAAVNLLTHYDFSDAFKLSAEGKFVETRTRSLGGFGGDYPATIALDNPFIPASILNTARQAGLTSIDISRNNFDIPRKGEADRRRTWRGVLDATGRISANANYDVSAVYGETDVRATKLNDRLADRFTDALDAVLDPASGQTVCRSVAARNAGCVPVNLFGGTTVNPASFAYYLDDPVNRAKITQTVLTGSIDGDFGRFFRLPGGPVQFAAGLEYRRETSQFRPSQKLVDNLYYQYDEYIIPTPSDGHFDVREAFGELNAPILRDAPFAQTLSVGAAARVSHYSTIGNTSTYQFNAIWAPVGGISFRGSFGRAVRAPNIGELFLPATGTSNFFSDPCYVANRTSGTASRAANCTTLITGLGGNPATFTAANNPNATIFIPGVVQGNAQLKPEVARTWTVGTVLQPRSIPGLQVALDWYDIRLRDAISQPDANVIANLCVDQPSLDNAFCRAITRQAGTGYISGFIVQPQNVAAYRTAGLELNARYRWTWSRLGRFEVSLVGGYLHRLEQIATPGAAVENNVDTLFRPRWTANFAPTWQTGRWTIAYNLRWADGVRRFAQILTDNNPSYVDPRYFRFKPLWQHDLQVDYALAKNASVYLGVTNLGNERPDIGFDTNAPISPVGRSFYAGVRVSN